MKTTAPNFRTIAENLQSASPLPVTDRSRRRHESIIECARIAFAEYGFANISTAAFTIGMRIPLPTLRRHFGDLHGVLAEIVRRHLTALETILSSIAPEAPDPTRARREAYLAATRRPCGGFTADHLILVRDSPALPPDKRAPIEATRQNLARLLAGPNCVCPEKILSVLDIPAIDPAHMKGQIAKYVRPRAPGQPNSSRASRPVSISVPMPRRPIVFH